MNTLSEDISAFEADRSRLETDHNGKWVVFYNRTLEGVFDDFETAAQDAVRRFGRGPYLIRQVGAAPITLPASVMFRPAYANH